MKNFFSYVVNDRVLGRVELLLIILFAIIPLFATYPYRINIFLSWEGAYRLYLGHVPYRDFGLPLGYAYWVIPAVFFHIFGPFLSTLVKAQVFINIFTGLAFRGILSQLMIKPGVRFTGILVLVVAYSFHNFWPWYNHTVIAFEFVGIYFAVRAGRSISAGRLFHIYTILSCLFLFFSFFTKQDGGAFAILIGGAIFLYYSLLSKSYRYFTFFLLYIAIVAAVNIVPYIPYDFFYWFNYGQAPHYSRVNSYDILSEVLNESKFLKLYTLFIGLIIFARIKADGWLCLFKNKEVFLFILITLGILGQAFILQVTSYTPPEGNIYFHAFAVAFILQYFLRDVNLQTVNSLLLVLLLVFFWWSEYYWKYSERIFKRVFPQENRSDENEIISIRTYKVEKDTTWLDKSTWKLTPYEAFDRVYMPQETIDGIENIRQLGKFNKDVEVKVLNMSELTPLAHTLGYELEKGTPLWYHLNVAMFHRELEMFKLRIQNQYYDMVLFEIIPNLNNFFPYELQDELKEHYRLVDTFQAPRRTTQEVIEVYVKK